MAFLQLCKSTQSACPPLLLQSLLMVAYGCFSSPVPYLLQPVKIWKSWPDRATSSDSLLASRCIVFHILLAASPLALHYGYYPNHSVLTHSQVAKYFLLHFAPKLTRCQGTSHRNYSSWLICFSHEVHLLFHIWVKRY